MKWILSRVGAVLFKVGCESAEGQTLKAGCLHLSLHRSGGSWRKVQKSRNTEIDPVQERATSESVKSSWKLRMFNWPMNVQCSFWSVVTKGNIRIMVRNWRIGARDAKQSPTNFQLWQSPQFSLSTYFHYTFIHTHTGREQLFEEKEKDNILHLRRVKSRPWVITREAAECRWWKVVPGSMALALPQAGQDFQINSRLVPPNPSEAHTHHSSRGQTSNLVICQSATHNIYAHPLPRLASYGMGMGQPDEYKCRVCTDSDTHITYDRHRWCVCKILLCVTHVLSS